MKYFRQLWKWLQPPGPVELGRSERDALPMQDFGSMPGDYTWEDWEAEVQNAYPFRFWLTHTFPRSFLYPIRRRVSDVWYWLIDHLLSSRRFHLVDLRCPGPRLDYKHGWIDQPEAILYACFVLLRRYVEQECPRNPTADLDQARSDEERQIFQEQVDRYHEIMAIYSWWMQGRLDEEDEERRLRTVREEVRSDSQAFEAASQRWFEYREMRERREQEMLERLIRVRENLWT